MKISSTEITLIKYSKMITVIPLTPYSELHMATRIFRSSACHMGHLAFPGEGKEYYFVSLSPTHFEGMTSYINWLFKSYKSRALKPETKNIKRMISSCVPKNGLL